jgi:hypothetical protein
VLSVLDVRLGQNKNTIQYKIATNQIPEKVMEIRQPENVTGCYGTICGAPQLLFILM